MPVFSPSPPPKGPRGHICAPSGLPTPQLNHSHGGCPKCVKPPAEISGPVRYIASLFPSSIPPPSLVAIEIILLRARASPYTTVALIGCIVDALSTKFYRNWVNGPVVQEYPAMALPEVIFVGVLSIAEKFLNDTTWGMCELWTMAQSVIVGQKGPTFVSHSCKLGQLEMALLEELDYRFAPLLANRGLEFMVRQFLDWGEIINYPLVNSDAIEQRLIA